jgi:hypothetical protein
MKAYKWNFNKYFFFLFKNFLFKWLCVILVKRNNLYLYLNSSFYLHYVICFLYFCSLVRIVSLMDITVVDFQKKNLRFEISYLF